MTRGANATPRNEFDPESPEIAWAAGIFEGEGCISPQMQKGHVRIRLVAQMQDRDPIERLHALIGGTVVAYEPKGAKMQYRWSLCGWENVAPVMEAFAPWLSARRLARWADVLEQRNRELSTLVP